MKNMKGKMYLLISLQMLLFSLDAQKIRPGNYDFTYEMLPYHLLPDNYKTYKVAIISSATDGIPFDKGKVMPSGRFIPSSKFENIVKSKEIDPVNGFFGAKDADRVFNPKYEFVNTEGASDLQIIIDYKDIELLSKENHFTAANNLVPQPNLPATCFNYKLIFKFPYNIKIIDKRKNLIICDTNIENKKTLLYPSQYFYTTNQYGQTVSLKPNGDPNPGELKLDYESNSAGLYNKCKTLFAESSSGDQIEFLKQFFLYSKEDVTFFYTRVKTKNPVFDICDTVSNLVNQITDSISFNSKKDKHLNWHTTSIKKLVKKVDNIWTDMLTNQKYLSEITDPEDLAKFKHGLKLNLVMTNIMLDNYKAADSFLKEVKSTNSLLVRDIYYNKYIDKISYLLMREWMVYEKHKAIYSFN